MRQEGGIMSGTYRPTPRYPALLGTRIAQAEQLARALQSLSGSAVASDPSFLWLMGRADEVRTLVDEIVREWSQGAIGTMRACDAIGSYVRTIHVALHRRYGEYGASCCGPHLEPFAGSRQAEDGMRQPLKSGVLEVVSSDPPASQTRARARGAHRQLAAMSSRRRQAV
jgi:hypothetical protein